LRRAGPATIIIRSYNYTGGSVAKKSGGKKGKKKDGLPIELVEEIQAMKPELLTIEAAREQLAIDTLKEQMAADDKIQSAQSALDQLNDQIDSEDDVIQAKAKLEEVILSYRDTDEYIQAKETLKAEKHVWQVDIRDRKKKLKLMMKTIKAHINSGALKLKP
jgi:prophage DNA circulation protein